MSTESKKANTFTSMSRNGVIKRLDKGMFAERKHFHVDPTFNKRRKGARLDESIVEGAKSLIDRVAEAKGIKKLKDLGEFMPQIEVYPHPVSGVIPVEGHRRLMALDLLADWGYPIPLVPLRPFSGDAKARKLRIATSQGQLELEPMELADLYLELERDHGMTQDEIATEVNKTRQHVEQMMLLGRAPSEVKEQILADMISPGTAVGIVRQHKEGAAQVIQSEYENALAQGKKKVTDGTIKKAAAKAATPSVPRALATDMAVAADRLSRELPADTLALVERYRAGESALGDTAVPITIRSLNALLVANGLVKEAQADQARKVAQKAEEDAELAART